MNNSEIKKVFKILARVIRQWKEPIVTEYARVKRDPYKILISTIISLRTKDAVTGAATDRLWKIARKPADMAKLSARKIEKAIYPAGFYHTKAENIREVSRVLVNQYSGRVPDTVEELVQLKGVGRKTANLVVTKGYNKPGICVDTHVHRIVNRWNYVKTPDPDKTETALRKKLPEELWVPINDILVTYGQNLCMPVSPFCSRCAIRSLCARKGVKTSR